MTRRALAREAQETVGLVDRTEFVRLDATRRLSPERRGELGSRDPRP